MARGWCSMHWKRWNRNGDPLLVHRNWSPGNAAQVVGYHGAHKRLRTTRGHASGYICAHCGGIAREWAYDHGDPEELSELLLNNGVMITLRYSMNFDYYVPLCQPCHTAFDRDPLSIRV